MTLEAQLEQDRVVQPSDQNGYFRHFGLKRDPFGVAEKESDFYLLPNWDQQIDLMLHYILHENVLLLLVGSHGVGKTTFINVFLLEALHGFSPNETAAQSDLLSGEFLVQVSDRVRTCQLMADSNLHPEQMLEVIVGAFELDGQALTGSLAEHAEGLLEALQENQQDSVLLIDDAEVLPETTLGLLLSMVNQQSESQHRFHVVLIGESLLKKRLAKINKAKEYNLTHMMTVEPLNLTQTEYYLRHRFIATGLQGELPFSNGFINKIYKLSGGVPKLINQLARQALLDRVKKNKFSSWRILFKPYKKTFLGGIFLLASFAMILLYLGQDIKAELPRQKVVVNSVKVVNKTLPKSAPVPRIVTPDIPVPSSMVQTSSLIEPESKSIEQARQVPLKVVEKPFVAAVKVRDSNALIPASPPRTQNTDSMVERDAEVESEKTQAAVKKAADVHTNVLSTKQMDKKKAAHYTLKLVELGSKTAAKAFIIRYKLGSHATYYAVNQKGVVHYVVAYGEYADAATAKQALLFLPKSLQQMTPKPYRMGLLQSHSLHAHANA